MDYQVQSYCMYGEYIEVRLKKETVEDTRTYLFHRETCIHGYEELAPHYQWHKIDIEPEEESVLWHRFRLSLNFVEPHQVFDYYEYLLIQQGIKENAVFHIKDDEEGIGFIFLGDTNVTRGFLISEGDIDLFTDMYDTAFPCPLEMKQYLQSRSIPFDIHFNEEEYIDMD